MLQKLNIEIWENDQYPDFIQPSVSEKRPFGNGNPLQDLEFLLLNHFSEEALEAGIITTNNIKNQTVSNSVLTRLSAEVGLALQLCLINIWSKFCLKM